MVRTRSFAGLVAAVLLIGSGMLVVAPAAQADDGVSFTATLAGTDIAGADANDPLRLPSGDDVVLDVQVRNDAASPVEVRTVRLASEVLGLSFFTYATRVDLTVPAGASGSRTFAIDLSDLGGQATGTLPATVQLLAPDRDVLDETTFAVDVRGDVSSVYGIFGLAIAALTALLLVGLVVRLFAGRLPDHRLSRAWRFTLPGLGLGLTLTFTASALRILVPSPGTSLVIVVVCAAAGFVLGYLSPQPDDGSDDDELDERDVDLDGHDAGLGVLQPAAAAPAHPSPPPAVVDVDARTTTAQSVPPPPPTVT